jgi:hypothetical protein
MKRGILYMNSVENVSQPQQPQVSDKVLILTRFGTTRERVGEIKEVKKNVGGKMTYVIVPLGKGTEAGQNLLWDAQFQQSLGKPKQEFFLRMLPGKDELTETRLRVAVVLPQVLREKSPAEGPKGKLPDLDADGNGFIDKSELAEWFNKLPDLNADGLAFDEVSRTIPADLKVSDVRYERGFVNYKEMVFRVKDIAIKSSKVKGKEGKMYLEISGKENLNAIGKIYDAIQEEVRTAKLEDVLSDIVDPKPTKPTKIVEQARRITVINHTDGSAIVTGTEVYRIDKRMSSSNEDSYRLYLKAMEMKELSGIAGKGKAYSIWMTTTIQRRNNHGGTYG